MIFLHSVRLFSHDEAENIQYDEDGVEDEDEEGGIRTMREILVAEAEILQCLGAFLYSAFNLWEWKKKKGGKLCIF